MITKKVTVKLKNGLEARSVALLVQVASKYKSKIYLSNNDGKNVNAKSIMGVMTLGLLSGDEVAVSAEGEDETEAVDKVSDCLVC